MHPTSYSDLDLEPYTTHRFQCCFKSRYGVESVKMDLAPNPSWFYPRSDSFASLCQRLLSVVIAKWPLLWHMNYCEDLFIIGQHTPNTSNTKKGIIVANRPTFGLSSKPPQAVPSAQD